MTELPPLLIGFLDGLCVASKTHFPEGGMYVRNFYVDDPAIPPWTRGASASAEELMRFFVCALGDTTQSTPLDAKPVVDRLFEILDDLYPKAKVHIETTETRGWFDGIEVWVSAKSEHVYLSLDWSVS